MFTNNTTITLIGERNMKNIVYIATSSDGFIATKEGGIEWLHETPEVDEADSRFYNFDKLMNSVDALIMGRNTYEKVLSFGIEWPYSKKVFVLTTTLEAVDPSVKNKVEIVKGPIIEIVQKLNASGHKSLYIDGGKTIQSFLKEDLIDEMIITLVPKILSEGISLFENDDHQDRFRLESEVAFENGMIQKRFKKKNCANVEIKDQ